MKTVPTIATVLGLSMFCGAASADYQSGVITGYLTHKSASTPVLIVKVDTGTATGCNTTSRFAMAADDPRYQGTLAAVIAAYHTQATVKVAFTQTCTAWSNSFDMTYMCVGDIPC